MIITRDETAHVQTTFDGERVKMGVDPAAMSHIMSILSGMYSDPSLAVVREYSTNAIDAQVEYGWTRPVEITSPTWADATFSVQDFGVGMDADTIRNVYANYGASTKRDSNDYNGAMGIGSKSAFSYTNQFTVESNRNGIKTIVVVSRDDDGGGDMTIVSESRTDQPSGTKISVPVNNQYLFNEAINKFTKALAPGLVLTDGKDNSQWGTYTKVLGTVKDKDGNVLINGIYHTNHKTYVYEDVIYMGGVAYPALDPVSNVRTSPAYNIMVDVPLGAVQFSPSRESLMDTKKTRSVIELAGRMYQEHLSARVRKDLKTASNIFEAVKFYYQNINLLSEKEKSSLEFDGIKLLSANSTVRLGYKNYKYEQFIDWTAFNDDGSPTTGRTASKNATIHSHTLHDRQVVFIKGYEPSSVPARTKERIQYWAKNVFKSPAHFTSANGMPKTVYLFNQVPDAVKNHSILSHIDWVEWDDIKAVKMPSAARTASKRTAFDGKRLVFDSTVKKYTLTDMTGMNPKNLYYVIGGRLKAKMQKSGYSYSRGGADETFNNLSSVFVQNSAPGTVLVNVYANSERKFLSEFPKAKKLETIEDFQKPMFDNKLVDFKQRVDAQARTSAILNDAFGSNIDALMHSSVANRWDIDDPALRSLKTDGHSNMPYASQLNGSMSHHEEAEQYLKDAQADTDKELDALKACYPMVSVLNLRGRYGTQVPEEVYKIVVAYLNEIYENKEN